MKKSSLYKFFKNPFEEITWQDEKPESFGNGFK